MHFAQVGRRWDNVYADNPINDWILGDKPCESAAEIPAHSGDQDDATHGAVRPLLALTATLDTRLLEQLAMLLLCHSLATLFDY